jgi:pimeloyl-ACP methyl ester carboxylesterase
MHLSSVDICKDFVSLQSDQITGSFADVAVVPEDRWAIGGHSLGGLGASLYAGAYGNQVYAAVFHAGGWLINLTQSELPVLQMYGTLDDIFSGGYERYRYLYVDPPPKGFGPLVNLNTIEFIPIVGANHYQVGDYGYQAPDQIATISLEQQHIDFAEKTVSFLDNLLLKKK